MKQKLARRNSRFDESLVSRHPDCSFRAAHTFDWLSLAAAHMIGTQYSACALCSTSGSTQMPPFPCRYTKVGAIVPQSNPTGSGCKCSEPVLNTETPVSSRSGKQNQQSPSVLCPMESEPWRWHGANSTSLLFGGLRREALPKQAWKQGHHWRSGVKLLALSNVKL